MPETPLIGNHLEGHIYSAWLQIDTNEQDDPIFPILIGGSGGHTELILMEDNLKYKRSARRSMTLGEAFDKVAPAGSPIRADRHSAAVNGNPRLSISPSPNSTSRGIFHSAVKNRRIACSKSI